MGKWPNEVAVVVAGEGIEVDSTNPRRPIVSATGGGGGLASVVGGQNILVDDTDPANPIVSLGSETLPAIVVTPEIEAVSIIGSAGAQVQVLGDAGDGSGVVGIVSAGAAMIISSTFPVKLPHNADVLTNLDPTYGDYVGVVFDELSDALMYSDGTAWITISGGSGPEDSGLVLLASRPAGGSSTCSLYGRRIGGQVTLYLHSSTEGNPMAWTATRWFVPGEDAYYLGIPEQPDMAGAVIYTGWTPSPGTDMIPEFPGVFQFNNGGQLTVTPEVGGGNVTGELSLTIVYTTADPFPEPVPE